MPKNEAQDIKSLLLDAAAAIQLDHQGFTDDFFDPEYGPVSSGLLIRDSGWLWNPLIDCSAGLDLMVKLRLSPQVTDDSVTIIADGRAAVVIPASDHRVTDTLKAITEAAAIIGARNCDRDVADVRWTLCEMRESSDHFSKNRPRCTCSSDQVELISSTPTEGSWKCRRCKRAWITWRNA